MCRHRMKTALFISCVLSLCQASATLPSPREALLAENIETEPALFTWTEEAPLPTRYAYRFDVLPPETWVLMANEDYIVTLRGGSRSELDFWKTSDLSYCMSAYAGHLQGDDTWFESSHKQLSGAWSRATQSALHLYYDASSSLFGLTVPFDEPWSQKFGSYIFGFDLKRKQGTKKGDILPVHQDAPADEKTKGPFCRPPFDRLNDKEIAAQQLQLADALQLRRNPYLADVAHRPISVYQACPIVFDSNSLTSVRIESPNEDALDADALLESMLHNWEEAQAEERAVNPALISGLPENEPMAVSQLELRIAPGVFVLYPKRWKSYRDWFTCKVKNSPKPLVYLYWRSDQSLYPLTLPFIDGSLDGACRGVSDMGRITISTRFSASGEGRWAPACVYIEDSGKVRPIITEKENLYEWTKNYPEIYDAPIRILSQKNQKIAETAEVLSVWNRISGAENRAYWIAASSDVCTLYHVDEQKGEAVAVQTWGIHAPPRWLPERRFLTLPLSDYSCGVVRIDPETGLASTVGNIYMDRDIQYALVLPNGHYTGTPGCEAFLQAKIGMRTMGVKALAPWRNRPAEVLAAFGGSREMQEVAYAATKRWLQRIGRCPDASLDIGPEPTEFPEVSLSSPSYTMNGTSCTVHPELMATSGGPARLEVFADGVKVAESEEIEAGTRQKLSLTVPLIRGLNRVEMLPVQVNGDICMAGEPQMLRIYCDEGADSEVYIVAVGVAEYEDENLRLQYAVKDAEDIAATFAACSAGKPHVLTLTNDEVKHDTLLQRLSAFLGQTKPADRVICYVSGHGFLDEKLDYYYAPVDADSERLAETAVSMEKLVACLQSVPARKRLLMLDTCHAGLLGESGEEQLALSMGALPDGVRSVRHRGMKVRGEKSNFDIEQKKKYIEDFFSIGLDTRGVNILAASGGAEFAYETSEVRNGLFTAAVIKALRGEGGADADTDGVISAGELAACVSKTVYTLTKQEQRPVLVAREREWEIPLSHHMGYCIEHEDWDGVRAMAARGFRMKDAPDNPQSWLGIAMEKGAPLDIVETLLKCGADPNMCHSSKGDGEWWWLYGTLTPLKHLFEEENIRDEYKADRQTNIRENKEFSYALDDIVPLLLRYGAQIKSGVSERWPMSMSDATYLSLLEKCPKVNEFILERALRKPELLRAVVERLGLRYVVGDETAEYAMLMKSDEGEDTLRTLIELGMNVDARGPDGKTALLGCAECGGRATSVYWRKQYLERIRFLIQSGAKIDAEDSCGKHLTDYWPDILLDCITASKPPPVSPTSRSLFAHPFPPEHFLHDVQPWWAACLHRYSVLSLICCVAFTYLLLYASVFGYTEKLLPYLPSPRRLVSRHKSADADRPALFVWGSDSPHTVCYVCDLTTDEVITMPPEEDVTVLAEACQDAESLVWSSLHANGEQAVYVGSPEPDTNECMRQMYLVIDGCVYNVWRGRT